MNIQVVSGLGYYRPAISILCILWVSLYSSYWGMYVFLFGCLCILPICNCPVIGYALEAALEGAVKEFFK